MGWRESRWREEGRESGGVGEGERDGGTENDATNDFRV